MSQEIPPLQEVVARDAPGRTLENMGCSVVKKVALHLQTERRRPIEWPERSARYGQSSYSSSSSSSSCSSSSHNYRYDYASLQLIVAPSVCPFVWPSIRLTSHPSICQSVHRLVCKSVSPSIRPFCVIFLKLLIFVNFRPIPAPFWHFFCTKSSFFWQIH